MSAVFRKIALDPFLLLAAERRIGDDHIHPILFADFRKLEPKRIARVNMRRVETVQQQIHLAKQIRQRLWLARRKLMPPADVCGRATSSPACLGD